jgi:hypothetical protein
MFAAQEGLHEQFSIDKLHDKRFCLTMRFSGKETDDEDERNTITWH